MTSYWGVEQTARHLKMYRCSCFGGVAPTSMLVPSLWPCLATIWLYKKPLSKPLSSSSYWIMRCVYLQNWVDAPGESTQKPGPKKSPPRFPKSPPKPAPTVTVTPTAAAEDSDDDFHQFLSATAERAPETDTEREEIEWGLFKQRRSCGKPARMLDSQSAVAFLSEDLEGALGHGTGAMHCAPHIEKHRDEEDLPLADRGKRKLPQAGGRRVKQQHSAPESACSGESAGVHVAPMRIPRIAVASQQGSQDVELGAKAPETLLKRPQGRQSAPAAARSPAPAAGGSTKHSKAADGWKGRSTCDGTGRAAQNAAHKSAHVPVRNHSSGAAWQGSAAAAKSPLQDSGNIPFGDHAHAQKWARDGGDRDYKCKQEPEHPADRSPRRSARISQHNFIPAADADKALANLSQMCMLTQSASDADDPDYKGGRPILPLHVSTTDHGTAFAHVM